ncbi:hypothetical protein GCM10027038_41990 [Arthrobacter bambusae]
MDNGDDGVGSQWLDQFRQCVCIFGGVDPSGTNHHARNGLSAEGGKDALQVAAGLGPAYVLDIGAAAGSIGNGSAIQPFDAARL